MSSQRIRSFRRWHFSGQDVLRGEGEDESETGLDCILGAF